MVAKYTPPDNTTQNGAAYKSNLDGAIVAGARIDQAFLPQAQDPPTMTVRVLAGALMIGGVLTEVAAQNTGTITAPVTNPRIDRVVLNPNTGAIQVVTGTPAASPVAPAIPADRLPICRFQLATSTTAITNSMIVDERVGAGGGSAADDSFVDVASAATVDLGAQTSRALRVTGTTAITSFGATTPATRKRWTLRFAGALTLTHNATSLILPSNANIVTAAGDVCEVAWIGGANFVVFDYTRADGRALVAPSAGAGFGDGADGALNTSGNVNLATSTGVDDTGVVVRNYTSVTINAGHTVTAAHRARAMVIRATGNVTINGTLHMNSRGAAATVGGDVQIARNVVDAIVASEIALTVFRSVQVGGAGAAGVSSASPGANGANGGTIANGTGGGGSGGTGFGATENSGAGSAGTAVCGGTGGGGRGNHSSASAPGNGAANGGAGGIGGSSNQSGAGGGGGGAGNPGGTGGAPNGGGAAGSAGGTGPGGLLIIIAGGSVTIGASGVVSANGANGGNGGSPQGGGGGGAGGGRIIILSAGAYANSGTVQANGGTGGTQGGTGGNGGAGGAGAITQAIIQA